MRSLFLVLVFFVFSFEIHCLILLNYLCRKKKGAWKENMSVDIGEGEQNEGITHIGEQDSANTRQDGENAPAFAAERKESGAATVNLRQAVHHV